MEERGSRWIAPGLLPRAAAAAAPPPPPLPAAPSGQPLFLATPPVCCQVRELRLRDVERVTRCGAELLARHARKLDGDEREWGGGAGRWALERVGTAASVGAGAMAWHAVLCQACPSVACTLCRTAASAAAVAGGSRPPPPPRPPLGRSVGRARAGGGGGHGVRLQGAGPAAGQERAQAVPRGRARQPPRGARASLALKACARMQAPDLLVAHAACCRWRLALRRLLLASRPAAPVL